MMGMSPIGDSFQVPETSGLSSHIDYADVPSTSFQRLDEVHIAPRAELDAMSVDSLPFEASRYDNLDLVQRRGSIQHKKNAPALAPKMSR